MINDRDIVDTVGYLFFMAILALFIFLPFSCHNEGLKEGRCVERWKYQKTQQDTLQTIRSGCEEQRR